MGTSDVRDQLQAMLGDAYRIDRELAPGGMSRLFLATERSLDRPVVIKLLPPEYASEASAARFQREVTLTAHLQHPHILPILSAGSREGLLYYVMPYVEGESLRQRLEREGTLSVSAALQILREVADALARAHEAGVVHRDIKPENILLQRDHALLADFGVARALHEATGSQRLTDTGMGLGTPGYMAPEQLAGDRSADARADVYALAVVGYEMLAGVPPFTGPTPQAVAAAHFASAPKPLTQRRPEVPELVSAAIAKALAKEPDQRFATAADFSDALVGDPSRQQGRRSIAGRWVAVAAVALVAVAGASFGWRSLHRGGQAAASGPTRLAVLPFDTRGDTANAYFADGITDEIRGKLSALPALQVIARTGSNEYRRTPKPAEQIGRELGVQYLLTGTVQSERGASGTRRVRVSPELVQVSAGRAAVTKWQQSYDTTLADVFDVQAAVATRVADKIGLVLSPPAQTQLASHPTQNLAAYDAYLRSMALDGEDPPTVRRALAEAEHAVALDSTFAAAWARVSTRHVALYINSIPSRADAEAARQAAERAVALAPTAADGYIARGYYNFVVAHDMAAARAAYETAIRHAPSSSGANGALADAEAAVGQWAPALGQARQAVALDPRSAGAAHRLSQVLLWLRRSTEARAEAERGLTLAPADLELTLDRAMSRLGEGDLTGVRAGLRDIPPTLDRSALAAYMATYWDLYWALDSADRSLVLTLPPSAFDDDRGAWGIVRAELYWLGGDAVRARRFADTARAVYETQLRGTPDDSQQHLFRGLALAYLGQRTAAVGEGARGLALAQATGDGYIKIPYARHLLARIYVALGDQPHAFDQLDSLLAKPYFISPAWLTIDPTWAPLRGNPRFERLIAQPTAAPRPTA